MGPIHWGVEKGKGIIMMRKRFFGGMAFLLFCMTAVAGENLVPTRAVISGIDKIDETAVFLIQDKKITVRSGEKISGQLEGDRAVQEYVSNKTKPMRDEGNLVYSFKRYFQVKSNRFVITFTVPELISRLFVTSIQNMIETVTLNLSDLSNILVKFAMITHHDGQNPELESSHETLLKIAEGTILYSPIQEETIIVAPHEGAPSPGPSSTPSSVPSSGPSPHPSTSPSSGPSSVPSGF